MTDSADTTDTDELDRKVVQDVLSGDTQAFRTIIDRYSGPIYSLAHRLCPQPEDAEEAVQEIFLKAYHSLSTFQSEHRFFSWLYSIAVNHLRSLHRSRKSQQDKKNVQLHLLGDLSGSGRSTESPEQTAVKHAAEQAVSAALSRIPAKHREVFVLRHIQELSSKETAAILGLPENTVKTYLLRARRKMAKILINWGGQ